MKFVLALLVANVSADLGTPCSFQKDECGDATKFCCGVGSGGQMCTDATCGTLIDGSTAPNAVFCNEITPKAWNTSQKGGGTDGTEVYFTYPADKFTCVTPK